MRFVFLLPDGFDPRGGVRRVVDYAELLGRAGHECVIVTNTDKLPAWLNPRHYTNFSLWPLGKRYFSITCDVAWATGNRGGKRLGMMRHAALKVYSVVMLESLNRREGRKKGRDDILTDPPDRKGQPWLYIANSTWLRNAVRAKKQKCEMIIAAPRAEIFHPDTPRSPLKGRHATVFCLGSRGDWKGSHRSAAAIGHARSKWSVRGRRIESWVFGPGKPSNPGRPLRRFGIVGVHQLPKLYAGADVTLHSSAFEGWANIPFESLCCGTPFVTFNTKGIGDFAVDGYNCRIVPAFDEQAMGDALLELLSNRRLRDQLRQGCIETFHRFCKIDTVGEIERIVTDGLAKQGASR